MTIGRVVWRGTQAAGALVLVVVGLTWLNRVSAAVMEIGGSCASGGPYEIARPCPGGTWMAPAGIFLGLAALAAYAFLRPAGSPQLVLFAWPALFGSLGIQFLRAASAETDAYGFWLCGVLFLAMAAAPVALALWTDRAAVLRALLGDGRVEPEGVDEAPAPRIARVEPNGTVTRLDDLGPVANVNGNGNGNGAGDPDLAESLDRLARLHRQGSLSDAEFTEAKQQVLGGG